MLNLFDIESAKKTILKRVPINQIKYPERICAGVASLFGPGVTPIEAVEIILESVQDGGDDALLRWSKQIDRVDLTDLRIPRDEINKAYDELCPTLVGSLNFAAGRIREYHRRQPIPNWHTTEMGGVLGQKFNPMGSVGVYVPGGSAPLPSSLLMSVIPAQVAGVQKIIACTPPNPHPTILAAAKIIGIDEIYQVGGAQAIAAMAFGTESIPRVDKIVGAGNLFVTLAKKQVYGTVGLDGLFGPTETMIIADLNANPAWVAADLLAQAEHDILASAILLTPDRPLADAVQVEIARQLELLSREQILLESLSNNSGIIMVPDLDAAVELANGYGAEHLCLSVANPKSLASKITNAGGIFLGEHSFEVLGDYVAGPSHIMPTSGSARFASPLNVLDFLKITSIIALDSSTAAELGPIAIEIANSESLGGHAAAAEFRSPK
jgi:histidinol dehydrogenase